MPDVELESFGIASVIVIFSLLGAIWGAIFGAITAVLGAWQVGGIIGGSAAGIATGLIVLGFAILGLVIGALSALFYNILARYLGGIKVSLDFKSFESSEAESGKRQGEGVSSSSEGIPSDEESSSTKSVSSEED